MKKLLFGLIAIVMFGFVGNAQTKNSSAKKSPWLALLTAEIDIAFGQNEVINGVRYKCIGGGICYIKLGRQANQGVIKLSDVKTNAPLIAIDVDGGVYLVAREDFDREEMRKSFVVANQPEIDAETISLINSIIQKANPNAKEFRGITKGTNLSPYLQEGFNILKLN